MTRSVFTRRACAALFIGLAAALSACIGGGGSSSTDGNASVRVINATNDLASVDLYIGSTDTFPSNAADALSNYATVATGTYDVKITSTGNTSSLLSNSNTFAKDQHYTAVIWGRNGALHMATLPEDEDTTLITTAANGRVRLYNATSDSGSLDVYLTQGIDDLANATPTISATTPATLSGFKELAAGSYRLRVTGAGDNTDLRLDVPAVAITAQAYQTLIITAGSGGVLVNGAMIIQQGALAQIKNTQARVRVMASAETRGTVAVQLDGTTLSNLRSPNVGPYTLVNAGSRVFNVLIDGTSVSNLPQTLVAGGDYTLLGYGNGGAGMATLLADDNRLPAIGRFRIRLINGAVGTDPLTLSVDYAALASDVPAGTSSAPITASTTTTTTTRHIEVSSTSGIASLYTADPYLQSAGVYTVVVLGGNVDPNTNLPVPKGVLLKDR